MLTIMVAEHVRRIEGGICAVEGVWAGGTKREKDGLALVRAEGKCVGMYTKNAFRAAPLLITRSKLAASRGQTAGIVVSSGNANSFTDKKGLEDAQEMTEMAAAAMGVNPRKVLVSSTGIIGCNLKMEVIKSQIGQVAPTLTHDAVGSDAAARAILTTDKSKKEIAVEVGEGSEKVVVGAIAKGAGMVEPNLATMLAFAYTDAQLPAPTLKSALKGAVERSFNMLTIDRDTSTNDMVLLTSVACDRRPEDADVYEQNLKDGLNYVCCELARMMAADAEGASTLITVNVNGAHSLKDARRAARTVAGSTLVKTAVYGRDPNWGRVVAALGYSRARVSCEHTSIEIGGVCVLDKGKPVEFDEKEVSSAMETEELVIDIDLAVGGFSATAWGCDLTHEYVEINSRYRT